MYVTIRHMFFSTWGMFSQIAEKIIYIIAKIVIKIRNRYAKLLGILVKVNITKMTVRVIILHIFINFLNTFLAFSFGIQLYKVENKKYSKENVAKRVKKTI